jgi:hypothetical protein
MTRTHAIRLAAVAALMLALGAWLVAPATAAPTTTDVQKLDVTGAVFTCEGGVTYTVVSGDAVFLIHESTDANGGYHITGTIAPSNVTLLGSDGQTYRLAGAAWFGGNFSGSGGDFTDTEFFNIIDQSGGVVAKVSIVSHITVAPDGTVTVEFEKNRGTCEPPEDEE